MSKIIHKLGIVVPYRDRESHLEIFIPHMKNILREINHRIVVVEQDDDKLFNRAKLLNIGYETLKNECDYFCFHDVDLLPTEAEEANYDYVEHPTHLARLLETLKYLEPPYYEEYFGGATMFNKEDFEKINGFSNEYWGWGVEDDDLRDRCLKEGLTIKKRMNKYTALPHPPNGPHHAHWEKNHKKHSDFRDTPGNEYHKKEGLNTLQVEYTGLSENKNYIHVKVKL